MSSSIKSSCLLITFLLGLIVSSNCINNTNSNGHTDKQTKGWCTIKARAPYGSMQKYIDYACGQYSCNEIQPGGSCYQPNTLFNHASYCVNMVYQATGHCEPDIAVVTFQDPSYGNCRYVFQKRAAILEKH